MRFRTMLISDSINPLEILIIKGLHLAPAGSSSCDYGVTVPQDECVEAGRSLWPNTSKRLHIGSGGTCSDGSWGQVPLGCSVQSGGNGAAHYKTSGDTGKDCILQLYQLVCRNESKSHFEAYTITHNFILNYIQ